MSSSHPWTQQDKYGCTVYHQWARSGRAEELARAASTFLPALHVVDRSGNTPLHVASTGEVVRCLSAALVAPPPTPPADDHGASLLLSSLLTARNSAGCTPLTCAVVAGRAGVVAALLQCVDRLSSQAAVLESRDSTGRTALLHAAERGDLDVCELLLRAGAVATAEDDLGWCALHNAALGMYPEYESHLGVLRLLLGLPSPPSPAHPDRKGLTPLHVATDPQAVGILHRAGASPNAVDHDLRTPLHSARDAEVAQALLGAGAQVNARDVFGRTPLHSAVSPDCVRVLVARGALVNATDKEGRTPLDAASTSERREIASTLAQHGAVSGSVIPRRLRARALALVAATAAVWAAVTG